MTFDAYGDQASAGTRAYAYDALGRLAADTPAAGGSGYQFSYAGATGAIASDGTSAYAWDPAGTTLAATGAPGGGTGGALALTDIHGNQAGQFTASATALAASRSYDPWGAVTATSGSMTGLLGYQSAWADPASGKDLTGARWYNPAAGDFTSADTIPQSPLPDPAAGNPFAYAADNPLTGTDPSGHQTDAAELASEKAAAVAAAAKAGPVIVAVAVTSVKTATAKATAAKAAAKIPAHCAGSTAAVTDVSTCLSAVYQAAGGQTDASGVPTGKGYNSTVADQAMSIVQDQYNAAQDATQKRDAAANYNQQASQSLAAQQAALRSPTTAPGCSGRLFELGACPSEAGAAGTTAAQVKASIIGAGMVFLQLLPGPGELADALGIGGEAASVFADGAGAARAGDQVVTDAGADTRAAGGTRESPTCGSSFTAGTLVLLATGKTTPISQLRPGDKVLASDTRTGKDQPEAVTAVLVHHDTNLYDLTVKTSHGTQVIHTTASHLFWDPSLDHGWIPANHLKKGEHLKTPDNWSAIVVGGSTPVVHDGWMWDLTVPGNNDHDFYVIASPQSTSGSRHTYYVNAGSTPVLVHNDNPASSRVPDLTGKTQAEADQILGEEGFDLQAISQSGAYATYQASDGSKVTIRLSDGRVTRTSTIDMGPNIKNRTQRWGKDGNLTDSHDTGENLSCG